jgi:hypothetical protein
VESQELVFVMENPHPTVVPAGPETFVGITVNVRESALAV